jgi:hypothetical protein
MKRFLFWMMLIVYCCACGRGKYYVSGIFRKGDVSNMDTLLLDSSYHFYQREVYRSKNEQMENVLKTALDAADTANKVRIEVEYLLLSWQHKNAVYISTVPDKYQHYYSAHNTIDTLINAYDFSTFHFGKITPDGESIIYKSWDGKQMITWDIRPFINGYIPKKLSIREIAVQQNELLENVILINKALEEPLVFNLQKNFTIIFEPPNGEPDSCRDASGICRLADNKIYFNRMKHGYDTFFRFNKNINDSRDSAIGFDSRRTRYTLFQEKK